jgi:hypothetical protein
LFLNIIWSYVENEEVLHRVNVEINVVGKIKRMKSNRIGHILRMNCFLKHVTEGKIDGRTEATGRRRRRYKRLLDYLKEKRR